MSSSSSSPSSKRLFHRVLLKEIEDGTENFDELYAQGQGKGKFYIARIMLGRTEITRAAVKRLKPNSSGFEDEIEIMPKIQHPNIVSLLGYCDDSGQKILIYEHMANGSLADYLWKTQEPTATISLSWQQRLKICLDAALGLEHLHTRMKEGVYLIHGEIKPDNILLDTNWVAKIFCSSVFEARPSIAQRSSAVRTGKGDHYAPEYVSYQHISIKTDVYAFGMMLLQVLCGRMSKGGKPPLCWHYNVDLRDWAQENVDSKIFREISHNSLLEFTRIILDCLTHKRYERPTMGEVRIKLQNVLERQEREDLEAATKVEGSRKCQRISLKEIEDATEKFDEQYALGHGGEATVYSAQIMLSRGLITRVAVKHLKPNSSSFEAEIQIMPKIQHPNIVSLLGYCNDSGQKILIYEYMANGSLASYLRKKQTTNTTSTTTTSSLSWQQRLKICLGVALGLKHLHAETKEFSKGIIHRDIKPENILLDANWVAKISDFGMFKLSRADQIDSAMPTMQKGTGGYFAPEYLNYGHVTRKIDVYAFGVVLFQVLCQKMPWDREGESYYRKEDEDLGQWARQNVDSEIQGEISDYCLNAFTGIIQKCLSLDPKKRPTMDEVVLTLQDALEC